MTGIAPERLAELRGTYFRAPTVLELLDEIDRLRAVIRSTHDECRPWKARDPIHAPAWNHTDHCKLYEIEP